jgi:predicted HTH transcriptional regulator
MLFEKLFDEISETDILDLIKTKTIEQKTLEYKESLPDSTEKSKDKFLSTVAAFANSSGGLIIYGLRENNKGETYCLLFSKYCHIAYCVFVFIE